ncbi:MAG: tail fiber domain-containing protein [Bacteroidota bacterium]
MKASNILLFSFFVALATLPLHAQSPVLSIQGLVQKSFGAALTDGTYNLTFKLYSAETGGTALWSETQPVEVAGGVYSALLGSVEALDLTFNTTYYLGVTVQGGTELLPRARLTSTPYALSLIGQGNIFPSTGAIGAGTNAPADGYQLHVKNGGGAAKLLLESASNNNAVLEFKKGTSAAVGLTYNGTNLHFPGTMNVGTLTADNLGTTYNLGIKNAQGANQWHVNLLNNGLNFAETGAADGRIFIKPGGNVGIGNTSPKQTLHVAGDYYGKGHVYFYANEGDGLSGTAYIQARDDSGTSSIDMQLRTKNGNSITDAVRIKSNGRVGIGITSPQAPLHVTGTSGNNSGTDIKYFNVSTAGIVSASNWMGPATIFATGSICATDAFVSGSSFNFSDARIKHIIGRSDAAADLARLNRIEITRYTYLDSLAKGSAMQTKVIAQQLKAVMPEAVSFTRDFLPDVMQVAQSLDFQENEKRLTVTLPRPHGLSPGDRIKCLDEKGAELFAEVLTAPTENSLTFSPERQPARLFVYGKQVNDFHVVDYDAISMLNVSATQELARRVEQLQWENAALRNSLESMESRLVKLENNTAGTAQK